MRAATDNTPRFLGLAGSSPSGRGGAWDTQLGGVGGAGEGVVIGVVDTGEKPKSETILPRHVACCLTALAPVQEHFPTARGARHDMANGLLATVICMLLSSKPLSTYVHKYGTALQAVNVITVLL
jgi:hypothetical protein